MQSVRMLIIKTANVAVHILDAGFLLSQPGDPIAKRGQLPLLARYIVCGMTFDG